MTTDKGFIVLGGELENGGRSALRVDSDGIRHGEIFPEGHAPNDGGELTRIKTEQIAGPIYEVTEEESLGRPAMVNSRSYRNNWDNIFGNKQAVGAA